jgi:MOSC domain-containing protein YiiM
LSPEPPSRDAAGRLIGIARRAKARAPMEELRRGVISIGDGLEGDARGRKFARRRITVLSRESWEAALWSLAGVAGPPDLPWTTRRANLLVEGVRLPRARGARLGIGGVVLEVTDQTSPCGRMDEAYPGLLKALHPEWRGGVTCAVLEGGAIELGDEVRILFAPPDERLLPLPGE